MSASAMPVLPMSLPVRGYRDVRRRTHALNCALRNVYGIGTLRGRRAGILLRPTARSRADEELGQGAGRTTSIRDRCPGVSCPQRDEVKTLSADLRIDSPQQQDA